MNKTLFALPALLTGALFSCAPISPAPSAGELDLSPPVLLRAAATGPESLILEFDEPCVVKTDALEIQPALAIRETAASGRELSLAFAAPQAVGLEYRLRVTVEDAGGNSAWLIVRFYGFNPSPPRLLINEFTTRGSDTHPDLVELKAMSGGNLGGVAFCCGAAGNFKYRFVFPACTVQAGDFILLHLKPENIPAEIDETGPKDASGGLDASAEAYDFWVRDGGGLSGNNGALSLYACPAGALLDAVLYSNRVSEADVDYRGFGTYDVMVQADEICAAGGWQAAGQRIAPEDAVNPDGSTATRSISRGRDSRDTDAKADWHIVPTRKSSFGGENSDEIFTPE